MAIYNGHADVAALLIEEGADLTYMDNKGNSLLDIAIEEKHQQLVAILHEYLVA